MPNVLFLNTFQTNRCNKISKQVNKYVKYFQQKQQQCKTTPHPVIQNYSKI